MGFRVKVKLLVDQVVKHFLRARNVSLVEFCMAAVVAGDPVELIILYFKSAGPEAS